MAQAAIPIAAAVVGSLIGAGAGALLAPKVSPPPQVQIPTRMAAASLAVNDTAEFRRRRGAAANMITGPTGAEAPSPGAKALLGQ